MRLRSKTRSTHPTKAAGHQPGHRVRFPRPAGIPGESRRPSPEAGPDEHDIARPAEFLLDSRGTVCWVNLTENYWVRATPEQMLEATKLVRY